MMKYLLGFIVWISIGFGSVYVASFKIKEPLTLGYAVGFSLMGPISVMVPIRVFFKDFNKICVLNCKEK